MEQVNIRSATFKALAQAFGPSKDGASAATAAAGATAGAATGSGAGADSESRTESPSDTVKDLEEDLKKEYDIFNQAWSEIFDLVQVCALLHSMRLPVFPREYGLVLEPFWSHFGAFLGNIFLGNF